VLEAELKVLNELAGQEPQAEANPMHEAQVSEHGWQKVDPVSMYPVTQGQAFAEKEREELAGQLVQKEALPVQVAQEGIQLSQVPVNEFWNFPAIQGHDPEVRTRSGLQKVQLLGQTEQVRQVGTHAGHTMAPTSTYPEAHTQVLLAVISLWLTVLSQEEQLAADPQQVRQTGEHSWHTAAPES
jgi:hypothetical protein